MLGARFNRDTCVSNGATRIVMEMRSYPYAPKSPDYILRDSVYLVGHSAAVRIAKTHRIGAAEDRLLDYFERVLGTVLIAVVKVLRVEYDLFPERLYESYRVADHFDILIERNLEYILNVHLRALAEYRNAGSIGADKSLEPFVVLRHNALSSRTAEGDETRS